MEKQATFTLKNISSRLIIDSEYDDTKYFRMPLTKTYSGIIILDSRQLLPADGNDGRYNIVFDKNKKYTLGKVSLSNGTEIGEVTGADVGHLFSEYIKNRRKK